MKLKWKFKTSPNNPYGKEHSSERVSGAHSLHYMTPKYSPLAEAPYNPHSAQRRMAIIVFSESESASGFSRINHEWSCIPAFVFFFFYVSLFFFFLFFSSSLHSRLKATLRRAGLQRWSALVVSGLQMFGFLRGAAGDHATGHGAWTPKQLFPIVLASGADLYSSHSATTGYRTSVTAPDTPTVRKSSPAGSAAIVARRKTRARLKTIDWWKEIENKKYNSQFKAHFPRVVCRRMLLGKQMDELRAASSWCARLSGALAGWQGEGCRGSRWTARTQWGPRDNHVHDCVTGFEQEHSKEEKLSNLMKIASVTSAGLHGCFEWSHHQGEVWF